MCARLNGIENKSHPHLGTRSGCGAQPPRLQGLGGGGVGGTNGADMLLRKGDGASNVVAGGKTEHDGAAPRLIVFVVSS